MKVHLHHFSKIKGKKSHKSRFFLLFLHDDRRIRIRSRIQSIPLTSGSGSGSWRPKNMWIRWIRIRNTDLNNMSHGPAQPRSNFSLWPRAAPSIQLIFLHLSQHRSLTTISRFWGQFRLLGGGGWLGSPSWLHLPPHTGNSCFLPLSP